MKKYFILTLLGMSVFLNFSCKKNDTRVDNDEPSLKSTEQTQTVSDTTMFLSVNGVNLPLKELPIYDMNIPAYYWYDSIWGALLINFSSSLTPFTSYAVTNNFVTAGQCTFLFMDNTGDRRASAGTVTVFPNPNRVSFTNILTVPITSNTALNYTVSGTLPLYGF